VSSPVRRRAFFALLLVPWLIAFAVAVVFVRVWREEGTPLPLIDATSTERSWNGEQFAVLDPVVGWRPRRDFVDRYRMAPLGGRRVPHVRVQNNLGLIRSEDVTELPKGRRVLLLGDSHLMGVVSNSENASDVLERLARERSGDSELSVYNASCHNYSLYQYVLRARTLIDRLRPDTLLAVIFAGNDLLELEDLGRPHIDDSGVERRAVADPLPETATRRLIALRLSLQQQGIFWQGLNQASYFRDYPERMRPMLSRMRRSLELLSELAANHDAALIVAVLPSFDLIFPERVAAVNEPARALMARNVNVNLHAALVATLYELGIPTVDLRERFRTDASEDLFADDYHIYVGGHGLVADALVAPLLGATR
jgi:hypothetical protein